MAGITSVRIENLRGIRNPCAVPLTPLTVLVGKNGSGKSTVLDALLIAANPAIAEGIKEAVLRRAHRPRPERWLLNRFAGSTGAMLEVHGAGLNANRNELHLSLNGMGIAAKTMGADLIVTFPPNGEVTVSTAAYHDAFKASLPSLKLIDGNPSIGDQPLDQVYSRAKEEGRSKAPLSIAQSVLPGLEDVEILTEDGTPVLHLVYPDRSVPVSLAGDGIHMMLRIAYELSACPGGTILIEEPELHQHPGAIRLTARVILEAVARDVQIILTTHSLELIDALLEQADEKVLTMLSVVRTKLVDGELFADATNGPDARFARDTIEDDLR